MTNFQVLSERGGLPSIKVLVGHLVQTCGKDGIEPLDVTQEAVAVSLLRSPAHQSKYLGLSKASIHLRLGVSTAALGSRAGGSSSHAAQSVSAL